MTIEHRDPRLLREHPRDVMRDEPDDDLLASVKEHGVEQPLWLLPDGVTVVSGRRRRLAAIAAGHATVPVEIKTAETEADVLSLLLVGNEYREKTAEQKAREYELRKEIEAEKAKRRQLATQNNNAAKAVQEKLPEQVKGQARDKAAEAVGWSGRTAEKAAKVVAAIDEAEQTGDSDKAKELRTTLNTKGVAAAEKLATGGAPAKSAKSKGPKANSPRGSDKKASAGESHIAPEDALSLVGRLLISARAWPDEDGAKAEMIRLLDHATYVLSNDADGSPYRLVSRSEATASPPAKLHVPDRTAAEIEPELIAAWNAIEGVVHVRGESLNKKRRTALRERLREAFWRDHWREAIEKVAEIPALRGVNKRKWRADVEFFLRPDTVQRLIEGKYEGWQEEDRSVGSYSDWARNRRTAAPAGAFHDEPTTESPFEDAA